MVIMKHCRVALIGNRSSGSTFESPEPMQENEQLGELHAGCLDRDSKTGPLSSSQAR